MSIPGFTAESSIYKTSGRYHTAGTGMMVTPATASAQVLPQQACGFWQWISCAGSVSSCAAGCGLNVPCIVNCLVEAGRGSCNVCVSRLFTPSLRMGDGMMDEEWETSSES
jgi:hypothetical protein